MSGRTYAQGARVIWRSPETHECVHAEVLRLGANGGYTVHRLGDADGEPERSERVHDYRVLIRHPDGEAFVWASELEPDPSQPVRLLKR
jgi:hypothetical protein